MLVKVVRSQTNIRQQEFLTRNFLQLKRITNGRYSVLRLAHNCNGNEIYLPIGYTFSEGGYHIFVPDSRRNPTNWFFGLTRCDAISGYLDSLKSTDPEA